MTFKNRSTIFTLGNRDTVLTTELEDPIIVIPHAQKAERRVREVEGGWRVREVEGGWRVREVEGGRKEAYLLLHTLTPSHIHPHMHSHIF